MMRYCKLLLISMMLFTLTGCGCCCGCSLPLIAGGLLLLSCILLPIQKFLMNRITSHPDFYSYEGFRDFYRFPLVYPYHITMIDTYGRGWLEEYIGGDIENSSESSNSILSDISAIIREDDRLIFKLEKPDREGNLYGIFDYRSGEVLRFKDADSLRSELGMKDPLQFDSLEKAYNDYWHPAKQAKQK